MEKIFTSSALAVITTRRENENGEILKKFAKNIIVRIKNVTL